MTNEQKNAILARYHYHEHSQESYTVLLVYRIRALTRHLYRYSDDLDAHRARQECEQTLFARLDMHRRKTPVLYCDIIAKLAYDSVLLDM